MGSFAAAPNPEDGRSFLFELTARGDREWKRGWGALQRIQELQRRELADEGATRAVLSELGRIYGNALTDD